MSHRWPDALFAGATALWLVSASTVVRTQSQTVAPRAGSPTDPAALPWAFPVPTPGIPPEKDDGALKHLAGSTAAYSQEQIDSAFEPPDWHPGDHPPMPDIVAHGRKPEVNACSQCHLPNGRGNPESSSLAGQPAAYILQQMADYRSGARGNHRLMTMFAQKATDADLKAAADYYAGLTMPRWLRVVETDTAPRSFVTPFRMRLQLKEGGTEPLGQRIIELPEEKGRAQKNDSRAGFVAYVPLGSLKKGEALVTTGGAKTLRCGICHGPELKGMAGVPGLAGRSAIYTVRQLAHFRNGAHTGLWAPLMAEAVAKLTVEDMIGIAAYTASLAP